MQLSRGRGFSLVELMVAMVAGLILIAAITSLFASVLRANSTAMKVSRLNQELQAITDMIARDITRAGYDASAANRLVSGAPPSPFNFDADADWQDNCVLVRYDGRDENVPSSANGIRDDNEAVVYSYRADSSVWVDELPATVSGSLSTLCSRPGTLGAAHLSTEDTIDITDLTFSLLPSSQVSGARAIQLNISGQYKDNTKLKLNLRRDIKLRNDGYLP